MFGFYVHAFLMWLFFSMNGCHRDIWSVRVKQFRVGRYPFDKLRTYKYINCPRSIYYTILNDTYVYGMLAVLSIGVCVFFAYNTFQPKKTVSKKQDQRLKQRHML